MKFETSRRFSPLISMFVLATVLVVAQAPDALAQNDGKAEVAQPTDVLSETSSTEKIRRIPSENDDQKTEALLNSLAEQAGWFPEVKITVKSGMVTITGKTKDSDHLAWLAKTADRMPYVVAVINKASVEKPPVTDLTPAWNEVRSLVEHAKRALPLLVIAGLLFTAFLFMGRYIMMGVTSLWSRRIENPFLLSTVAKVTMVPIWILFFYLTLQTAGLSGLATTIIGGTGVLGVVLGFAFKDIVGNYLSGLLLAFRSPFTKGDLIVVDGYEGFVQSINMRGTTILDPDGNFVLIPNSTVIQEVIKNKTANPETRLNFIIGIGYGDSYPKAREIIATTLRSLDGVLAKPDILIGLDSLSASSADIKVFFWINIKQSSGMAVKAEAISRVKEALIAEGISLPDSSREIVFTDVLKIQNVDSAEHTLALGSQKAEANKRKAEQNLQEAKEKPQSTDNRHEEQVKQMGEGVDLLNQGAKAETTLYKDPEKAKAPPSSGV
ncbi:MAG: mechanosensitive ion channel [Proteobacteria bacterium]|nr:MAG: mechanosensitive ion channel [Pseudomonadota bacterium]